MNEVVLGIDIGGTGIKFGLVDREGRILVTDKVKTKGYPNPEMLPADLHKWAGEQCEKLNTQLIGVGIGTPNGNYYKGTIDFAPNLP
jgi:glucokinase